MKKDKKIFPYVVIAAVLIIPFMYSFFYLKAYWNPYGKGNINNLPVAIVNLDEGKKGSELIDSIVEKDTLKISVVDSESANSGLYDKTYYAVITIPSDFTSSMESIGTDDVKHPTITYSPNQKSNYLSSQIIDKIVTVVEKSMDNKINSEIVGTLTDKLNEVPSSLESISLGFTNLSSGISKLEEGSLTLSNGLNSLSNSYKEFNSGLSTIKNGSNTLLTNMNVLNDGLNTLSKETSNLSNLGSGVTNLINSVDNLNTNMSTFNDKESTYITSVNQTLTFSKNAALAIINLYETNSLPKDELYLTAKNLIDNNTFDVLTTSGNTIKNYSQTLTNGVDKLNESVTSLNTIPSSITKLTTSIDSLKNGSNKITDGMATLNNGINKLSDSSNIVMDGINSLSTGSSTLNNGLNTLSSSVSSAKKELDNKTNETKDELKKLDGLKEFANEPLTVNTKAVNEISSYGTAFSPFFISIALWVGALMMYIVLYYDKENRFPKLSIENENHLQRTILYHGLATLSAIILGILLSALLDFEITNYLLYYLFIILVSNTFIAIIEFLIVKFKDVGKFIALILLVLQLAAAGGTFPIETVTKGFRFLNPILPMTYTINLLKEVLVTIESSLLTKNLIVVIMILLVFFGINIVSDIIHDKENIKK